LLFVVIALPVPSILGAVFGVSPARILSLIASAFILQAAAPPIGLALGFSAEGILLLMAFFAMGVVVAILEVCDGMAMSSERVKRWIDNIGKKLDKYPVIRKYGAISCIPIAWIPGLGLYGTPVVAWMLGWKRIPVILFTTLVFTIAAVFVLFFAHTLSMVTLPQILLIAGIVVVCLIAG